MPEISEYLLQFVNLSLPGFIYLTSIFILLTTFTNGELLNFLLKGKFLFYTGILIIVFSYITGLVMHLAEQNVVHFLFPKFYDENVIIGLVYEDSLHNDENYKSLIKQEISNYQQIQEVLAMIRHLIYSYFCIMISLSILWFRKHKRIQNKLFFILLSGSIYFVLISAYSTIQNLVIKKKAHLLSYDAEPFNKSPESIDLWIIWLIILVLFMIPIVNAYFKERKENRKSKIIYRKVI